MNWISLFSQFVFCMAVTGTTGDIMLLIWFLCRKLLQERNPKLVYYMLRWVVIMYLLPITYVTIALNYKSSYIKPMEGIIRMLFVFDFNNLFQVCFVFIWIMIMTIAFLFFLGSEISRIRVCKSNFDDGESLAQQEFERIKEELGIKGKVELLRNDSPKLHSPFSTGIFKKKVVIPYYDYSKEELEVILYHELNHIKMSDVLFRYLTSIAIVLNGLNLFSCLLWGLILMWGEADCDARALEGLEKQGIDMHCYYDTIFKLASKGPKLYTLFYVPMLISSKNSLQRRIDIMKDYRANMRKVAKSVTVVGVMVFALISSVTAYAAGIGISEYNDAKLQETQIVGQYGTFVESEGWDEEMLIPASDVVDIIYINDEIMTLGEGSISWDVPVGTRCVTASIYMTKGTEVQIACTATPSDCTYWFGLMYASSECAVVEGSGSGSHTFTVPSTGYYRVMVENRSSKEIHVGGYYQY